MKMDYSLYLITDRRFLKDKTISDAVEEAIKGGVTLVQVREKEASTREFYNVAVNVKKVTDKYNIPLLIDDRIDIALASECAGVHLGQSDMPICEARKILGNEKIIGISAGNLDEAIHAQSEGADYIGIGTIFYTGTKKDIKKPIGISGLKNIVQSINIPSVAIGGINLENSEEVMKTGTNGLAVISAIMAENNIKSAAVKLKDITNKFL
ncbi:MAG: thiamine phosphate synthase [Clostridium sp.]|nr:thiamine phosphate synthase [Clostridium sp.]